MAFSVLLGLSLASCGGLGQGPYPEAGESAPPALASSDFISIEPGSAPNSSDAQPALLGGTWVVEAGGRSCTLALSVDANELSGSARGCSADVEERPIAVGILSGSSFLFQTGRLGEGWIWSGRYDAEEVSLVGRREHVVTGKLESFVARR